MEPSQEMVDEIFREKVLRARAMPPGQKILMGPQLFDEACAWTLAGIRAQRPEADDAALADLLRQRIELGRRLEGVE